jgi:hypothetical protein
MYIRFFVLGLWMAEVLDGYPLTRGRREATSRSRKERDQPRLDSVVSRGVLTDTFFFLPIERMKEAGEVEELKTTLPERLMDCL